MFAREQEILPKSRKVSFLGKFTALVEQASAKGYRKSEFLTRPPPRKENKRVEVIRSWAGERLIAAPEGSACVCVCFQRDQRAVQETQRATGTRERETRDGWYEG